MSEKYWNDDYWSKWLKKHEGEKLDFLDDLWLNKYEDIINSIPKGTVLDLGCGIGQYSKYFLDKGFDVVSADISMSALNKLKENIENTNIVKLDMSEKLEFADNTFDLVFANLSIHYFDKKTTEKLIAEIKRILKSDGYFIGSVNSTKYYEYIKDKVVKLDENYYLRDGINIRLFDIKQFEEYFKDFECIKLNEVRIMRWNQPKDMWEFIFKLKK